MNKEPSTLYGFTPLFPISDRLFRQDLERYDIEDAKLKKGGPYYL